MPLEISRSSRSTTENGGIQVAATFPCRINTFLDAAACAVQGVANASMDDDFVVRRQFNGFPELNEPALAIATARMLGITPAGSRATRWMHYYGKPLSIPHVSYSTALRADEVNDDYFKGKIILIGARPMAGTILERKDEFRSPLTSWGDRELFMPAVEVHATQLLNLLRDDSFKRLSPLHEFMMLGLTAIGFTWLLFSFRPLPAAGVAVLLELIVANGGDAGIEPCKTSGFSGWLSPECKSLLPSPVPCCSNLANGIVKEKGLKCSGGRMSRKSVNRRR